MKEKVVEVEWKGKNVKVHVGELTYGDVADIQDEVVEFGSNGEVKIKMGKLKSMAIWKAVKKVEGENGKTYRWSYNDVRSLAPNEAAKILAVVDEINDLSTLFRI